jgi:hypothetical protein
MLLKVVLAVALGSIGLIVLRQITDAQVADNDDQKQERLEQAVTAQLQSLRDHLFRR